MHSFQKALEKIGDKVDKMLDKSDSESSDDDMIMVSEPKHSIPNISIPSVSSMIEQEEQTVEILKKKYLGQIKDYLDKNQITVDDLLELIGVGQVIEDEDIKKNQSTSQDDEFIKPNPNELIGMHHGSYDKLNEKKTETDDIIISKVSPIYPVKNNHKTFKDNSEVYKSIRADVIDYNSIDYYSMRQMKFRSKQIPHVGDMVCLYDDIDAHSNTEVLTPCTEKEDDESSENDTNFSVTV